MTAQVETLILGATTKGKPLEMLLPLANRHGLIAGATGTGKTVSLQRMIEGLSRSGVPVFAVDIKGDLSGLGAAGVSHPKILDRLEKMPFIKNQSQAYPVTFWDVNGIKGHPLRTTMIEMGPLLLSSLLSLSDSQHAALLAAFKVADQEGLALLDIKDLKALLTYLKDHLELLGDDKALFNATSSQALLRKLASLEEQGADQFFGEPALNLSDILSKTTGFAPIHLLDASSLVLAAPKVYATFLLWLLAELFEQLPERGDADKPILALFFDEAHLLFTDTPKALQEKFEQVVRLIRSKGVGVYFITQSPSDIPDTILAQLGLRIQHGLRAFTVKEQKSLKAVADGFRENPDFNTLNALTELGIGEALVSVIENKGTPAMVERVLMAPPESRIGPLSDEERKEAIQSSLLKNRYNQSMESHSAYEQLAERLQTTKTADGNPALKATNSWIGDFAGRVARTATQQVANQIGRQLVRGIMGSLLGKR